MTVVKIIAQSKYLAVAVGVALVVIAFAAWLPNLHLITQTMTSATMTLWQKTNLITSLLGSLQINLSPLSRLLVFYLKQTARIQQTMGVSVLGVATSMLGVGCASCGSVILTSLIGFGSATAVLGFLPFRGQEFGFIGIVILLFAISFTLKKINQPYVCATPRGQ